MLDLRVAQCVLGLQATAMGKLGRSGLSAYGVRGRERVVMTVQGNSTGRYTGVAARMVATVFFLGASSLAFGYPWPEVIERQTQERLELANEQNIQENIEDTIEESIEQTVDSSVEESIDDAVAQVVEDAVEASVQDSLESSVEDGVEEGIEDSVEESVEQTVADAVEESVEAAIEDDVVASVETGVEDSVEASVEASVEESVEESVEDAVQESVAQAVESGVEDSVEASVEDSVQGAVEGTVEDSLELRVVAAMEERLETEIDEVLDNLESDLEVDESRILREQWLVMAEPAVFTKLVDKGYLFETVTELPGLQLRLAEVAAPSSFDITEVRDGVLDVVGKDRAEVDLNHIYTAGAPTAESTGGLLPRAAMAYPADLEDLDVRVGMIDSGVDVSHPALARSRIEARSFARPGVASPDFHGTAIASMIVGNADDYKGLAPSAELYAASVFELDEERGEIASTVSLIRALDWLISSEVSVINVSLAGPPNRLLEKALQRAAAQNVIVMAAAGNGGPMARPMYPAAYDSVVAVTAVDSAQRVFRLANRGDYLAIAAPGVDLRHAQAGGGYASSSGTSFAVPFAVTAAARLCHSSPGVEITQLLLGSATDLGPPGRDKIYGYGLLTMSGP